MEPVQTKTAEERKALLAQTVSGQITQGSRVESQSDFQAVLVNGAPVNHTLHLILSIVTCGLWIFVWGGLAIWGGEKRSIVQVDEYGNANIQR